MKKGIEALSSGDLTVVNICTTDMKYYVFIEPQLNDNKLLSDRFINRTLVKAGLKFMLSANPEEIYPKQSSSF